MRILIAEDELLERKAMRKFIEENFTDMVVVGEAVNGREAIELAKDKRPDIIFMDIKMPGINGLEAIEQINTNHPTIKFILVSAYDTFEFAKQAMQFGIKDYILKPGKKQEIIEALFRVRKEILYDATVEKEKQRSENLLRESFVSKVIQHPVHEEAPAIFDQLFSSKVSGYFLVLRSNIPYNVKGINRALKNVLDHHYILYEIDNRIIVFVAVIETIDRAEQLTLARKLSIELGEDMYIGIGGHYETVRNFPISYQEAESSVSYLKSASKSKYGFAPKSKLEKNEKIVIDQIVEEVARGNGHVAWITFKKNNNMLNDSHREILYIQIQHILTEQNITLNNRSLSSLQSNKDWHSYLESCCMKISEFYQSQQSMKKAKRYIELNYNRTITLEDAAASVNLSPNYFSNLFKATYGENFIGFLTKMRMEKARKLVLKNEYSLKEISFLIGYNDPNYFSRVFRRYYNSSPREYKRNFFKK